MKPNIILILADDMGYGDLSCLNSESKIHTPCMDKLAAAGVMFTDAHASSSVCTPSRYGILTGRYAWRGRLQYGVLGPHEPPLIGADLLTLPQFLHEQGYHTGCVGKWHLGMNWGLRDGDVPDGGDWNSERACEISMNVDYTQPVAGGPTDRGFDYYFGVDVPNFPPYAFIEQNRVIGDPCRQKPKEMFGCPGAMTEGWDLEQIMPTLASKAIEYIEERATENKPFFLYFPWTGPHTPIAPTAEWRGKSDAGIYGDWVMQLDSTVGMVEDALARHGLTDNTLIILTSDNGCPNRDGHRSPPGSCFERYGHNSSWILRGMKGDTWEGGHRIPCLAKWPSVIDAGRRCDEMICLLDIMATCADIVHEELPEDAAVDSISFLPHLRGDDVGPLRREIVHHGHRGLYGMRRGPWKLIDGTGSGGFSPDPKPGKYDAPMQLYNMDADISETDNCYWQEREIVGELSALLAEHRHRIPGDRFADRIPSE